MGTQGAAWIPKVASTPVLVLHVLVPRVLVGCHQNVSACRGSALQEDAVCPHAIETFSALTS